MANEMNLQTMNCIWERMNGPTWFSENSEFTLDYICVDDCGMEGEEKEESHEKNENYTKKKASC